MELDELLSTGRIRFRNQKIPRRLDFRIVCPAQWRCIPVSSASATWVSGEEAYGLRLAWSLEAEAAFPSPSVRIVATDIDSIELARASAGYYRRPKRAAASTPDVSSPTCARRHRRRTDQPWRSPKPRGAPSTGGAGGGATAAPGNAPGSGTATTAPAPADGRFAHSNTGPCFQGCLQGPRSCRYSPIARLASSCHGLTTASAQAVLRLGPQAGSS
jgi:hypothetical protein